MKRCKQCEELLALASWLLYSDPKHAVPLMKAQLNRLYGQLHALMGRSAPSWFSFLYLQHKVPPASQGLTALRCLRSTTNRVLYWQHRGR